MTQVWLSAAGLALSTMIGSLLGFWIKELPHRWNDTIMGFCAGVMLAAATIGLLIPATEMAGPSLWGLVVLGVAAGIILLNGIDILTPHLHVLTGLEAEKHAHNAHLNKTLLFVLAIAIHKLPEGLATGVGFNAADTSNAWAVTTGIALQNIPEGMVVIAPLLLAGLSRLRTFVIASGICAIEIAGVWLGYGIGAISLYLLPMMLALAGGAMLYVVSDEMIPETHAHGYQKQATYALVAGFMAMLFMDAL